MGSVMANLSSSKLKISICVLIITVSIIFSIFIRLANHDSNKNYNNYDATWHVLLTMRALEENPVLSHLTLPIVTLGGSENKGYKWGATIPTENGDYLYTSFPALGFFIPHIIFQTLNVEISVEKLMHFNFILHYISSLLVFAFTIALLKYFEAKHIYVGATALAVGYVFSIETLFSHGVIYWSHSLFQPIFIGYLLFLFRTINNKAYTKKGAFLNFVFCFLLSSIEWTGFLVGIASSIVLWRISDKSQRGAILFSLGAFAGIVLSGLYFVVAFLLLTDPLDFINALTSRFGARDAIRSNFLTYLMGLLAGYISSFGIQVVFLSGLFLLWQHKYRNTIMLTLFLITTVAMLENIIMLQHAVQYTFDRLKLFPLIIIGAVMLWSFGRYARIAIVILISINVIYSVNIWRKHTPIRVAN